MTKIKRFFIAMALSSLSACGGSDGVDGINGVDGKDGINGTNGANGTKGADGSNGANGQPAPVAPAAESVVMIKVLDNRSSRSSIAQNVVLRDQTSFQKFWLAHASSHYTLPTVDFKTSMVLGVVFTEAPNGCYSASITKVTQAAAHTTVEYQLSGLKTFHTCDAAMRNPAELVTVPMVPGAVDFYRIK
jgi:hypothetical protein